MTAPPWCAEFSDWPHGALAAVLVQPSNASSMIRSNPSTVCVLHSVSQQEGMYSLVQLHYVSETIYWTLLVGKCQGRIMKGFMNLDECQLFKVEVHSFCLPTFLKKM